MDRQELDHRLATLRRRLPCLVADNPRDADFWNAFLHEATGICSAATTVDDTTYVQNRIVLILAGSDRDGGADDASRPAGAWTSTTIPTSQYRRSPSRMPGRPTLPGTPSGKA